MSTTRAGERDPEGEGGREGGTTAMQAGTSDVIDVYHDDEPLSSEYDDYSYDTGVGPNYEDYERLGTPYDGPARPTDPQPEENSRPGLDDQSEYDGPEVPEDEAVGPGPGYEAPDAPPSESDEDVGPGPAYPGDLRVGYDDEIEEQEPENFEDEEELRGGYETPYDGPARPTDPQPEENSRPGLDDQSEYDGPEVPEDEAVGPGPGYEAPDAPPSESDEDVGPGPAYPGASRADYDDEIEEQEPENFEDEEEAPEEGWKLHGYG
eukprot:Skav209467  [mRNA]  locus=scaffold3498:194778:196035:+ [translate_table: standard]